MTAPFLLYGANGYTGALIAEACAARHIPVTLAGRNEAAVAALGGRLGLPHKALSLDDSAALDAALAEHRAVLHCAGPFSRTSKPMLDACLRTGAHYLDITGEILVFEACAARDADARAKGVMVVPGVGFDVVPSDCVAAYAAGKLPGATKLDLCVATFGGMSHGTATTMMEDLGAPGAVRRGGRIVPSPAGAVRRTFDLGAKGERAALSMPWGDVATAFHSTGIGDITVYFALSRGLQRMMRLLPLLNPLLAVKPVKRLVQRFIPQGGPDAAARARGSAVFVAEVSDAAGKKAAARLVTPEGYALTVETALLAVRRVQEGKVTPGFQTPSRAWGADFVLEVAGVAREDL